MNRGRPKISARPAMKKDLKTVENEFAGRQSQTMELKTNSTAGTMESSDIMIMLEPRTEGGIELELLEQRYAAIRQNRYAKLFLTRFRNTMFKMQK